MILIFCACSLQLFSQGLSNLWMMGYESSSGLPFGGTNIDFDNGGLPYYIYRNMPFGESNCVITDKNDSVLFYSNDYYIANRLDDTLFNSNHLNSGSYYSPNWITYGMPLINGITALPVINDSTKYLLLHEGLQPTLPGYYSSLGLNYSVLDMQVDSGHGGLSIKDSLLINDTLFNGNISFIKHGNGRDWWMLLHRSHSDVYYKILYTVNGFDTIMQQSIGSILQYGSDGQSGFSPDGARFALVDENLVEVFNFNRCDGMLSNPISFSINEPPFINGLTFSPNSKLLYVTTYDKIRQYNLDSANVAATENIVAQWDSFYSPSPPFATFFGFCKITPFNTIYISTVNGTDYLHVINNPNDTGVSCNVIQHGLHLPTYNGNTIAQYPNYFMGPMTGSICDSLGLGIDGNIYSKNLNLRVNPNPAQNSFYLNYELPTGKDATLYVYSTLGKIVAKQRLYSVNKYLQIHCDTWQQGMYYIKVVMDKDKFAANTKVLILK